MKNFLTFILLLSVGVCAAQTGNQATVDNALKFYQGENYKKALEICNKVIKSDKNNIDAVLLRGKSKMQLQDFEGAKKDFNYVLQLQPRNYETVVFRALMHSWQNNFPAAFKDYELAESINSKDTLLYVFRGETYFKMKKYHHAIDNYTNAIALSPKSKELYQLRSECYMYVNKSDLAQKDLLSILKIDSDDFGAKVNLAFCYLNSNKFTAANTLYEGLFEAHKEDPYILNNYGFVKFKLGQSKEGLQLINMSLKLLPENAYAYKYLALIHLSQNESKKACKYMDKGISLGFTEMYGQELEDLKHKNCGEGVANAK